MFEIENIAIGSMRRVARSPFGKALYALEVGQSFLVLDSFGKDRGYFSGCMSSARKKLNRKFSMRRVEGGYRIGRVA